jgi:hypothetical protein
MMKQLTSSLLALMLLGAPALAQTPPPGTPANRPAPVTERDRGRDDDRRDHDDRRDRDDRRDHDDRGDHDRSRRTRLDEAVIPRADAEARLDSVERLLSKSIARTKKKQDRELLEEAQAELARLRRDIRNAPAPELAPPPPPPVVVRPAPPPPRPPVLHPVSAQDLASIAQAIHRQSFGKDKLRTLEDAARSRNFLIAQVRELLGSFSFSKEKVAAVKILAPQVLDRNNAYQLYDDFSFSSEKAEVRALFQ